MRRLAAILVVMLVVTAAVVRAERSTVFFLHGVNVSEQGARAWAVEMFKRLMRSGADMDFCPVAWYSDKGQPYNYHENVSNAFVTASYFAQLVNSTSAYRADTNAVYRKEGMLFFDRTEERIIEQNFPAEDEYLVFRTRTTTNAEGRVTSAHYGRIGEKPSHMFGLKAAVWFNHNENDTILEDGWHR